MSKRMDLNEGIKEISALRNFMFKEYKESEENSEEAVTLKNVCMALTLGYGSLMHLYAAGYGGETDGEMVSFYTKRNKEE